LPFVPAVVDLVGPTPVLAGGGIADGRGLAAALSLGAAGALIGTRFHTSTEAIVDPEIVKAILTATRDDTERSCVLDIARGAPWPSRKADTSAREGYRQAEDRGDLRAIPVWASEAIDLISETYPAGHLVETIAADAEKTLRRILAAR
jgi:nitronate monooxygenase